MAYSLRFVDRPGGTVLLDVSPGSGGVQTGAPGPSFPPPPVNRRTTDNPVADGGAVASSSFGLRQCLLPLVYSPGMVDPALVGTTITSNANNPRAATTTGGWSGGSAGGAFGTTRLDAGGPLPDAPTFARLTWTVAATTAAIAVSYGSTGAGAHEIPVTPGETRTYMMWVRTSVAGQTFRPQVNHYTAAAAFVSAFTGTPVVLPVNEWVQLVVSGTVPATAARALVTPSQTAGTLMPIGGMLDGSAVLSTIGATVHPYFDGDARRVAHLVAWVGAAHASASTLTYLTGAAARRRQLQQLLRVLQPERVWLELVAHDGAQARYLHCYRAADPDMTAKLLGLGDEWAELTVTLLADPYAYGPKESLGTISSTEAAQLKNTISGASIKGDAPAPLICTITSAGDGLAFTVYIATKVGGGVHLTLADQTTTTGTLPGATTRTTVANANDYGGTHVQWNNVSSGLEYRISENVVISKSGGASDAKLQGTYRVILLGWSGGSTIGDVWEADLRLVQPSTWVFQTEEVRVGEVATIAAESTLFSTNTWVDMGLVEVPFGGRPLAAGFDADVALGSTTLRCYVRAKSIASPGAYGIDAFLVLPADDTLMAVQYADNGVARTFTVDPHSGQVVVREGGVNLPDVAKVAYQGSPPVVVPGVDVDIYIARLQGGLGAERIWYKGSLPTSVVCDYWPRYLTVV